jgi:hypothetical protein
VEDSFKRPWIRFDPTLSSLWAENCATHRPRLLKSIDLPCDSLVRASFIDSPRSAQCRHDVPMIGSLLNMLLLVLPPSSYTIGLTSTDWLIIKIIGIKRVCNKARWEKIKQTLLWQLELFNAIRSSDCKSQPTANLTAPLCTDSECCSTSSLNRAASVCKLHCSTSLVCQMTESPTFCTYGIPSYVIDAGLACVLSASRRAAAVSRGSHHYGMDLCCCMLCSMKEKGPMAGNTLIGVPAEF